MNQVRDDLKDKEEIEVLIEPRDGRPEFTATFFVGDDERFSDALKVADPFLICRVDNDIRFINKYAIASLTPFDSERMERRARRRALLRRAD